MRVLVTGATGYIGRHVVPRLLAAGHDVHVITRGPAVVPGVTQHRGDLLVAGIAESIVAGVRPEAVLHLAWEATPGVYWTSPDNARWALTTAALASAARDSGATRFVGAGTCAEYDWTTGLCTEGVTPEVPATPYGQAKREAFAAVSGLSAGGFSTAWARVFFLFGDDEHPSRLVPSVALAILRGTPALCSHGEQGRDFLHVDDVAAAMVAVLASPVTGAINIASGEVHRVREVIEGLAARLGRPDLVRLGAQPAQGPSVLAASADRLRQEVGWQPRLTFETALDAAAGYWRATEGRP